ncbi:MAG: PUR family DNA/RNA-binding protein [Alistipes sp.]|jgi:hypothetical protein|nr:PUR family DNA/RNA-binding protein [Alistipes sp.]
MGDGFDFRAGDGDGGEDVYSKVVRAGKRTYFFDVKATRNGDNYLTITESRKKMARDGSMVFEKNKIFLYKEDFAKFADGFEDAVNYIKVNKPEFFEAEAAMAAVGDSSLDDEFDML